MKNSAAVCFSDRNLSFDFNESDISKLSTIYPIFIFLFFNFSGRNFVRKEETNDILQEFQSHLIKFFENSIKNSIGMRFLEQIVSARLVCKVLMYNVTIQINILQPYCCVWGAQSSRQRCLEPLFYYELSILGCFGQSGLQRIFFSKLP